MEDAVAIADPAPHLALVVSVFMLFPGHGVLYHGRTIEESPLLAADEEEDKGRDQGDAIAQHPIFPLESSQLPLVVPPEKGEVHIASYGKGL